MSPVRRILKWSVPVDDNPHEIGRGPVVHVACQSRPDSIEVWTDEFDTQGRVPTRVAQVYGTGHPIPADLQHVGSVLTFGGQLVWHVLAEPVMAP